MNQAKHVNPALATGLIQEVGRLKHEEVPSSGIDPRLTLLRAWQADRLARSYADISALPRYKAVMQFFLEDIYGDRDFSQRNHDMERMYEFMRRVAPEPVVRPLTLTVELHHLTESLDQRLLDVLVNRLQITDSISVEMYAEAYRLCDNYDDRVQQVELIHDIGVLIDVAIHMPFSGPMLGIASAALKRGGWSDLMAFMERGNKVFHKVPDTPKLMAMIRGRELRILNRIFEREADPFQFPAV